ncbi:MAG: PD-(D/E)XK nuclease family protein [Candidatus Zixiibacteriota bacterium]|nr:MAG: PD-(D/E)XK nuclease family protein [candidate division Zixibacteria bacterium]
MTVAYILFMGTVYSHSRLGMFRTCPRQYRFRYLDKVTVPYRVSADLYLGSAVHRQVERAYSLGADGVLYSLDDMIGNYRKEWEKPEKESIVVSSEYRSIEDYIRVGEEMLRRFHEEYQPFDQGTLLGAELRIRFPLQNSPFNFMAIIDRLWKRDDGVVEICDYKTGRRLPQGIRDPLFSSQMAIYQLAVQAKYPQFERIEVAQYFLRLDEVISGTITRDELDEHAERLRQEVLQIKQAERKDDFPAQEGAYCDYCDYLNLCPAKRHRLILETAGAADDETQVSAESASKLVDQFVEVDNELRKTRSRHQALKEGLVKAADELNVEKLVGSESEVIIRRSHQQSFVGKSLDPDEYVRLSQLVRSWGLDECFALDTGALMKDFFKKERLSPEQLKELKEFLVDKETSRVTIRRPRRPAEEEQS